MKTFPWFGVSRFFLFLTPFALDIVTKSTLFPFIVGKYVWFRSSVALALIFFALGVLFGGERGQEYFGKIIRVIRTPLGLAVTAFTAFFILAGMFGIRPGYSFWSNFERGEGGLQMLHLYAFFLLLSTLFVKEKDWVKILWALLWSAMLSMLYGVGAGLGYNGFIGPKFGDPDFRFQGSVGNPSYLAAFLLFGILIGAYLLVTRYRKRFFTAPGAVLLWIFLGAYGVGFLLAATRGAFLGLGGGALVGLAYLGWRNKKWRTRILGLALCIAATGILLVSFRHTEFVKRIPGSRIFDISFTTTTFEHRMIMWKIAWNSFKERPLLGWGPENFGVLFQKNFNPDYFKPLQGFGAWFDRAHNIAFDYLATTGVLGALAYASIFAVMYWSIFRGHIEKRSGFPSSVAAILLAVPTAYLIQGMVLFDVLSMYLNLFLFFALVWCVVYGEQNSTPKR